MTVTDYGTDIDLSTSLPRVFAIVSGQRNVANAYARRLQCQRTGLITDPNYGYDVRPFCNITLTPAALAELQSNMVAEGLKDERIQEIAVNLVPPPSLLGKMLAHVTITTADGPFDLILAISEVSVDVLDVGITLPPPAIPGTGAVLAGPPGTPGVAGVAGPAGASGSGRSITVDQDAQIFDTSGSEVIIYQAVVNFDSLPAGTIPAALTAQVAADAGNTTARLRIGGTDRVVDGTVLATITTSSATFVKLTNGGTLTNPTGVGYVKVTLQTSSPGNAARIRGMVAGIG